VCNNIYKKRESECRLELCTTVSDGSRLGNGGGESESKQKRRDNPRETTRGTGGEYAHEFKARLNDEPQDE